MLRDDEKQWLAEAEASTPGPWKNDGWDCFAESEYSIVVTAGQSDMLIMIETTALSHKAKDCQAWKDADFAASSRTAVPTLCQRLEAMALALRELLATATFDSARSIDTLTRAEKLLEGRQS